LLESLLVLQTKNHRLPGILIKRENEEWESAIGNRSLLLSLPSSPMKRGGKVYRETTKTRAFLEDLTPTQLKERSTSAKIDNRKCPVTKKKLLKRSRGDRKLRTRGRVSYRKVGRAGNA